MRNLLRRLGARTGISLGLILVVAVVLVVFRLIDDGRLRTPVFPGSSDLPSVAATAGYDGVVEPGTEPGADEAPVLATATAFTAAWLNRDLPSAAWLEGLRPYATTDLIERLSGVDPSDVPANATAGAPTIRQRSAVYADVLVPIGAHDALALGLVGEDGSWLVATLDRETG